MDNRGLNTLFKQLGFENFHLKHFQINFVSKYVNCVLCAVYDIIVLNSLLLLKPFRSFYILVFLCIGIRKVSKANLDIQTNKFISSIWYSFCFYLHSLADLVYGLSAVISIIYEASRDCCSGTFGSFLAFLSHFSLLFSVTGYFTFMFFNFITIHNPFTSFGSSALKVHGFFFCFDFIVSIIFTESIRKPNTKYCWIGLPNSQSINSIGGLLYIVLPFFCVFLFCLYCTISITRYFKHIKEYNKTSNIQNIYNHLSFHTGRYFLVSSIIWCITLIDLIMIIIFSEVLGYDQYHNPFFYLFNLLYGIKPLITLWYYRRNSYVNIIDNNNNSVKGDDTFPQLPASDINIIADIQRQLISILLEGMQKCHKTYIGKNQSKPLSPVPPQHHIYKNHIIHSNVKYFSDNVVVSEHFTEAFQYLRTRLNENDIYYESLNNVNVNLINVTARRSGAIFFSTDNGRYIIKTVSEGEYNAIKEMLPDYLEYMYNYNKNSLLPEFYGCYSLALKGLLPWSKVKIYLIVMKNLTPNKDDFIRFDLKGSAVNRGKSDSKISVLVDLEDNTLNQELLLQNEELSPKGIELTEGLKDNDYTGAVIVYKEVYNNIKKIILSDIKFLFNHNIMDYSLLLCIPKKPMTIDEVPDDLKKNSCVDVEGKLYIFGIIDVFQKWTVSKAFESQYKNLFLFYNHYDISSLNPNDYYHRFYENAFKKVFIECK